MPLLTSILLLLVLSRLFGELMVRLGQPALIGEILAGVVLGPAVLGAIAPTESLSGVAELSVFLIVLSAGLEMDFTEVSKAFRARGLVIATLGFFIPLFSGVLLGVVFRMDATRAIFLGLCMSITAQFEYRALFDWHRGRE
jgi:Kef-type K+ transport system membrane component KefB